MGCYLSSAEANHHLTGRLSPILFLSCVAVCETEGDRAKIENVSQATTSNAISTTNSSTFVGISPKAYALMNASLAQTEFKTPLRTGWTITETAPVFQMDTQNLPLKEQINLNFSNTFKLPKQITKSHYIFSKDYLLIESIGKGK